MTTPSRPLRSRRPSRPNSAIAQVWLWVSAGQVNASPKRLLMVWAVLMLGMSGLLVNLVRLQVLNGSELRRKAQEQQQIFLRPFVPRRQIIDRMGTVVALDRPVYSLFAHPKLFKESKPAIAEKLAPILNKPIDELLKRLDDGESGLRLDYALSEPISQRIDELRLDGLEQIQHQQRLYPQNELLANITGYVNVDHRGQAGVEYSQQNLLERAVKAVRLSRMGDGSLMPDQAPGGFLNVDDLQLQLTIDSRLQRAALAALRKQMQEFSAKRGVVIVMDAQDGSILAMASDPSFDPNTYYKFPIDRFKNWAITDLYEPGSTFKPINVAIALEAKAIQPNSVFYDEGQIKIDSWPIQNFDFDSVGAKGPSTVGEILKQSSNVGMVRIVQQMKPDLYYTWLKRLGLGEMTGIDLPSEVGGQFVTRKLFTESPIEPATTAFGQGFSLTAMQLVQFHGALANGGKLVTPHVVRGLFDSKGQSYWQPLTRVSRQIFSPTTAQTVLTMMETVVADGTGKNAAIQGYRIAGKTGTAQKAAPTGGYLENAKITSFVGVMPVEAPRYVVLAVVDEPQGSDAFGGTVTAPIVKAVMEAIITIEKIPPTSAIADPKPPESEPQ